MDVSCITYNVFYIALPINRADFCITNFLTQILNFSPVRHATFLEIFFEEYKKFWKFKLYELCIEMFEVNIHGKFIEKCL